MRQVFSPREVARAIGASESSIKRWCDRGVLPSIKTAGGHRRLPISGILEFVRSEKHQLPHPEVLGLPPAFLSANTNSLEAAETVFRQALTNGSYDEARRVILDLFLAQQPVATILDRIVASSLRSMGEEWCKGTLEVYEERRGCELASRLLYELRSMLRLPRGDAPSAMGGSPEGDPYVIPTRMVELVLIEDGWNALSLGAGIPIQSMIRAVEEHKPRLFWLSVSEIDDEKRFLSQYAELFRVCEASKTSIAVGGRAMTESLRQNMKYASYGENLQRLSAFANALYDPEKEEKR